MWPYLRSLIPGIVAGVTSTDVAAVATYSESGSEFGLAAIKFQLFCVLPAFCFQELGARVGFAGGRGMSGVVLDRFGPAAARLLFAAVACVAAYTVFAQFTGIVAVARLVGAPRAAAVAAFSALVLYVHFFDTFAAWLALFLSALLASYVALAAASLRGDLSRPRNFWAMDVGDDDFDYLVVSATVGGAIPPILPFYQCANAVRATGVGLGDVRRAMGVATLFSVACSCAITVAAAFAVSDDAEVRTIQDAGEAFSGRLGEFGTATFCLGLLGAATTSASVALTTVLWAWEDWRSAGPAASEAEVARLVDGEKPPPDAADAPAVDGGGPPAALCVFIVAANAALLWAFDDRGLLAGVVRTQDFDALFLPPSLALTIALARGLPEEAYSAAEYRAHVVGACLVGGVGLAPLAFAAFH